MTEYIKIFDETPEIYRRYIEPFINRERLLPKYNWMEKVVNGTDPSIFYQDKYFSLVPDIKWNEQEDIRDLHVLAIVQDRSIRSVRDLNATHIHLLNHIMNTGKYTISQKYDIDPNEVEVSIHYHPSFYWLHIHFTHIEMDEIIPGRSIFLNDIISNISQYSLYYSDSIFHLYIYPHMPLYNYIG